MDDVMDQARLYAQTVFAADGVFVVASSPEIRGVEAIRLGVDDFFAAVAALRHEVSEVPLSCANIWPRAREKIADYRIYTDLAPLFATTFG
jgi:hypothetical protein